MQCGHSSRGAAEIEIAGPEAYFLGCFSTALTAPSLSPVLRNAYDCYRPAQPHTRPPRQTLTNPISLCFDAVCQNQQRNRARITLLAIGRQVRGAERLPTIAVHAFCALEQAFAEAGMAPVQRVRAVLLCPADSTYHSMN